MTREEVRLAGGCGLRRCARAPRSQCRMFDAHAGIASRTIAAKRPVMFDPQAVVTRPLEVRDSHDDAHAPSCRRRAGAAVWSTSLATTASRPTPRAAPRRCAGSTTGRSSRRTTPITLQATGQHPRCGLRRPTRRWTSTTTSGSAGECHGVTVDAANSTLPDQRTAAGMYQLHGDYSGNDTADGVDERTCSSSWFRRHRGRDGRRRQLRDVLPGQGHYRTRRIAGSRQELIAVTIRIYNAGNKRVKTVTKDAGDGRIRYDWNGRSSSGALLPAGRYASSRPGRCRHDEGRHEVRAPCRTRSCHGPGRSRRTGVAVTAGTIGHVYKSGKAAHIKAGSSGALAGWQFKIPDGHQLQVDPVPRQRRRPPGRAALAHRDAELHLVLRMEHRLLRQREEHRQQLRVGQVVQHEGFASAHRKGHDRARRGRRRHRVDLRVQGRVKVTYTVSSRGSPVRPAVAQAEAETRRR